MKRVLNSAAVQAAIVWAGYLYLVLVARTTRWEVQGRDHLDSFASGRPCIVAFWHETLPAMPILWMKKTAISAKKPAFVLASRHEGYGMAYAEAMAHGLPVVGTRAGAVPSFVAGDLVAVDDPAALAAALRRLLSDPQARDAAAARARLRFLALPTWDATIASVAALVRRLGGGEGVAGD